jgi:hypothetical protein
MTEEVLRMKMIDVFEDILIDAQTMETERNG